MALAFLSALAVILGIPGALNADEGVVGLLLIGRWRGTIGSGRVPVVVARIIFVRRTLVISIQYR